MGVSRGDFPRAKTGENFRPQTATKLATWLAHIQLRAVEALLFFFQHSFSDLELSSLQILLLLHLDRKEEDEIISQFVLKKAEIMTFARPIARPIP